MPATPCLLTRPRALLRRALTREGRLTAVQRSLRDDVFPLDLR